mmetsp:Transcript_31926/g.63572  ORF Transcript_31926/g.63572 Transcript_31926/m.63572 type:complete len:90 (+) Transcript_31926:375-644(+)
MPMGKRKSFHIVSAQLGVSPSSGIGSNSLRILFRSSTRDASLAAVSPSWVILDEDLLACARRNRGNTIKQLENVVAQNIPMEMNILMGP